MKDRWATWYQDYQDGRRFRGRLLFGVVARVVAVGYRLGYQLHRRRVDGQRKNAFRPRARVIAVGNLTVGGSGKTSLVDYLASRLLKAGRKVTILTRGYGRQTKDRVFIKPGCADEHNTEQTGDEPLMLARRHPEATIIVDADRAQAAREFERQSTTDVFLLDDALQYHRMADDCRIMTLLDGELQPPYRLFPAGRWREPPTRAKDSDAVVLVVERPDQDIQGETEKLRAFGFTGPVFPFAYELVSWRKLNGQPTAFLSLPEGSSVGVFCGLARPERFVNWLRARGIAVDFIRRFADHYCYRQEDLDRLCEPAQTEALDFLLTTEKDAVKLTRFKTGGMRIIYPEVRLAPGGDAAEFDRFVEQVFNRE